VRGQQYDLQATIDSMPAAVQSLINSLSFAIETSINAVATLVKPGAGLRMSCAVGVSRSAIRLVVNAVTPTIQAMFNAIPLVVQARLNAVTGVGERGLRQKHDNAGGYQGGQFHGRSFVILVCLS
jgi:hypothetical protein